MVMVVDVVEVVVEIVVVVVVDNRTEEQISVM